MLFRSCNGITEDEWRAELDELVTICNVPLGEDAIPKGYFSQEDFASRGISRRKIDRLLKAGVLKKIKLRRCRVDGRIAYLPFYSKNAK